MHANARSRFGWSIAALTVLGLGLAVVAARGQTPGGGRPTVADVTVQGNRLVSSAQILGIVRTRAGNAYTPETVDEDVKRLMASKLVGNAWATRRETPDGKVVVTFHVLEPPNEIQDIVYQGAKHLKPDELNTLAGLRKGMPLNPLANQLACQAITRRYNELGRPFASCELLEGGTTGDTRVVFQITEGPKVKVSGIQFEGNSWVTSARLATQINSSKQILGIFGGDYNPALADLDTLKLEEYYKSFGFHDVKVSRELRYSPDLRYVTLVYHIHEGIRYKLGGIEIEGAEKFGRDQLQAVMRHKEGEYYNEFKAEADLSAVRDYYGWTGSSPLVKKELAFPEPGVCQVVYQIQERPPNRVGQVFIVGNEWTRQNVILRQVPLYPGQILTYPDLRQAEKNLARLNIFDVNPETGARPKVEVLDPDSDSEVKDILVSVQETRTGSLMFGVGVNSDAGLTGSIVLNERNFDIMRPPTSLDDFLNGRAFRGAGQEFRAEAVPGTQLQRYSVTFREPFLFDSQYSLTTGGYFYTRQFDEYDERRLGSRVTIGRKLNQFWSVSAGVRVENVDVRNVFPFAPPDILDAKGNNFLLALRAGVTRDSRDSFMRPTEGSLLDVSFEQGFGDFTFPVVNVEGNKYFTLWQRPDGSGRHVLALRSQFGWAGDDTPVFERFFAGGFRSMRGFQFRGVGPNVNGFMVGGNFMFLNSAEYQLPIRANDQMFLVGFVDSGTVEPTMQLKDYRVSAGFGVRFVVPMLGPVPIALDFGFPIVKAETDRTQIFSFWLGFFH